MNENEKWLQYNELTKNNPPNALLVQAVKSFNGFTGKAIDLGCGAGNDSVFLINNGWKTVAVDKNAVGLDQLKDKLPASAFETIAVSFEKLEKLPDCDLINASFSISFCHPSRFEIFMNTILNAIKDKGRFAGNFFGEKDGWAHSDKMSFCNIEKVKNLFKGFQIEYLNEREFDGRTAVGNPKHWHIIDVIAKKS